MDASLDLLDIHDSVKIPIKGKKLIRGHDEKLQEKGYRTQALLKGKGKSPITEQEKLSKVEMEGESIQGDK